MDRASSPKVRLNGLSNSHLSSSSRVQPLQQSVQAMSPVRIFQGQQGTPTQSVIMNQVPVQIQTIQVENVQKVRELETYIFTLQNEIEAYKKRCQHLENHLNQQANDTEQARLFEARIGALTEENKRLNELLKEKIIEHHRLRSQFEDATLQFEFPKLKEAVNTRQHEIDQLRHQFTELDIQYQQVVDQRRDLQASITEIRAQSEIREKSAQETIKRSADFHKSQVQYYEDELVHLKALMEEQGKDVQKWKAKYNEADQLSKDYGIKFDNADEQAKLLRQEIDRLSNFLDQKAEEIENWRIKNTQLEGQLIQCQSYEVELRRLSELIGIKTKELDDVREQFSRAELESAQSQSKNRSLEIQIDSLREQIRKLQSDSEVSLKTSQRQLKSLQDHQENEIVRLSGLLEQKNQQLEEWRINYTKKSYEYDQLKLLEITVQDYEQTLIFKKQELLEVSNKLREKTNEAEDLKLKYRDQGRQIEQLTIVRHDKDELENRIKYYLQDLELLRKEKVQKIDEIEKMTFEVLRQTDEAQRAQREAALLKDALEHRIAEVEDWKRNSQKLESQVSRLAPFENDVVHLRELNDLRIKEIEELRTKLAAQEVVSQQLESTKDEIDGKCRQLVIEIERLQKILTQRGENIDALRQNLAESDNQLQIRSNEYNKIEYKLREYETKLNVMAAEIEKLTNVLKLKSDEYEHLVSIYGESKLQVQRYAPFEGETQRLQQYIRQREHETEELQRLIQSLEQRLAQLQNVEAQNRDLEDRIQLIMIELQRSQTANVQKDRDNDSLRRQVAVLDTTRIETENQIALLKAELDRRDKALSQSLSEITTLQLRITELQTQTSILHEYEYKVQILNQEIDRLTEENTELQRELETWRYKYAEWSHLSQKVQDLQVDLVLCGSVMESQAYRLLSKEVEVDQLRKSSYNLIKK